MKKRIIRILSVLVCLCMVCTLHPITSLAEGTTYNLWVGGVEVTDENKDNITGPGILGGEGSKVSYDPTSKTLTLDNVSIVGVHSFANGYGTATAGIYYTGNDFYKSLKIELIGTNAIQGALGTSDISSYGIFNDSFWWEPTFTGNGSLTIKAGDGKADNGSWSVGIYSENDINVGANCTITATSGEASTSAAIYIGYWNAKLSTTWSKVTAGDSDDSATEVDITSDDFTPNVYKYMKIEPAPVQSVTAINVTDITAPVIGQAPDFSAPSFGSAPENAVDIVDNSTMRWLKIAKESYTGSSDDIWTPMTSADTFEADYYYCYGVEFQAKVGYKIPKNVAGTINGNVCTVISASENYPVMLKTVFGPLTAEHTHNLTLVPEKSATCTEDGNTAYYECSGCDKWFSDAQGESEIADHNSVVILHLNHIWADATCTEPMTCQRDGCGVQYGEVNASNHKNTELRNFKQATCFEKGYTGDTWCLDCGEKIKAGKDIEMLEHKLVFVKSEQATAAQEGNIEYYYCDNCNKYYSDEDGFNEIAKETVIIEKIAPQIINGNNATFNKSSKEHASFRSNAAFADFIRVEVDGKELVKDRDYKLKSGSIIVTLTPDFVSTLPTGEHTLGIVSTSGTALANFTVTDDNVSNTVSDNYKKSPETGNNTDNLLLSIIAVISLAALYTIGLLFKKKKVK